MSHYKLRTAMYTNSHLVNVVYFDFCSSHSVKEDTLREAKLSGKHKAKI